jgi:hypothetical protein
VVPCRFGQILGAITLVLLAWGAALINAGKIRGGLALCGGGILLFLACFGVFVKVVRVGLDRTTNLAEVVETGVLGRKRSALKLGKINGATLQSKAIKRRAGGSVRQRQSQSGLQSDPRVWRVAFAHGQNPPQPLTKTYGSEATERAVGGAINAWFGRPAGGRP